MEGFSKPTPGCFKCKKCEGPIGICGKFFCGNMRLTEKQLFNKNGYCSRFEPKQPIKEDKEK